MNLRKLKGTIMMGICGAAALSAAGMLLLILVIIFLKGIASLTPHFILFTEINSGMGLGTGIANAIVGTILLAITSTILAIPFAIGTAIYLKKYAPDNHLTRFLRLMIEVLSGTPSIVLGIFGVLVLVVYLRPITGGESLFAGTVALAILILPVIERATEDAIARVSKELEEGSYALGATKWLTIRNIIVPSAFSGIIVGAILGFGRAAEESAVVILTAGYSQNMPEFRIALNPQFLLGIKIYPLNNLVGSLPVFLYTSYENSNVFPVSSIFAAGFILIMMVMLINISAKGILSYATAKAQGHQDNRLSSLFRSLSKSFRRKKPKDLILRTDEETAPPVPAGLFSEPEVVRHGGTPAEPMPGPQFSPDADTIPVVHSATNPPKLSHPGEKIYSDGTSIRQWFRTFRQKMRIPVPGKKDHPEGAINVQPADHGSSRRSIRPFIRALLPFTIPLVILILIAILAGIPPLNHALGPASPSLAALFSTSLTLIVAVAGLVFGLFVAKRGGAFRAKNRKAGAAGVAAGFCLVLAVACVLSSAGSGLFNTGNTPASASSSSASLSAADRSARLAALLASEGLNGEGPTTTNPVTPSETSRSASGPAPATSVGGVPVRDALSLRENYQYGDPSHAIRATIYDVKVLPFYFWWWADWNRFVQQVPATGDSYLVVFIRIENTGKMSAIIPSADQFNVTYNGVSYGHSPYFDLSLADQQNINDYSAVFPNIPYEWIRELGQDKRDYAFLMGYNIFEDQGLLNNTTATPATPTPAPASTGISGWQENSVTDMDYLNYNLKPGPSQAIDGYLIYEVPDAAVNDLKNTYMQVAFNGHSATRWCLG